MSHVDADIVCSRARNHFDPLEKWDFLGSDDASSAQGLSSQIDTLDKFQKAFRPLHNNQKVLMYFSVSKPYRHLSAEIQIDGFSLTIYIVNVCSMIDRTKLYL